MEALEKPRPKWVRIVLREGMKRSAAKTQTVVFLILFFIAISIAAGINWDEASTLGKIAVPLELVFAAFVLVFAIWMWTAVRWVDRNGKWA